MGVDKLACSYLPQGKSPRFAHSWLKLFGSYGNPTVIGWYNAMIGKKRQLATIDPVEFEKQPVEVQDCRKFIDHFRGICRIYPNLNKENRKMSTWNRLDLQTLESQPVMPNNLPDHWYNAPKIKCYIQVLVWP